MSNRSARADVRNPLLADPVTVAEFMELRANHPEAAEMLQRFLRRQSKRWRALAQETWDKHKAPVGRYQRRNADDALDLAVRAKAAGVYARHLALVGDVEDTAP